MKNHRLLTFLLVLTLGALTVLLMDRGREQGERKSLKQENIRKTEEADRLRRDIAKLRETLKEERKIGTPPSPERMAEVFGRGPGAGPSGEGTAAEKPAPKTEGEREKRMSSPPLNCVALEGRIRNFFSYLDTRDYSFDKGAYACFLSIKDRLSRHSPIAGGILTPEEVLKNSFHFYRSLGKKDIRLIKRVLENEKDAMEQAMNDMYEHDTRCRGREPFLPPLSVRYEYAHFFLHSLSGRSYLFRLGGNLQVLLLYYATMTVHEANMEEANRYGLDIRPYLKKTEAELKNTRGLYNVDKYLEAIRKAGRSYRFVPPA